MLDLDDFKLVNDTFGHQYGDRVLVYVAETLRACLRGSDVAARYGGDEFALILPETPADGARHVAERILAAFHASPFTAEGRQPFPVGASIGFATHPQDGRSATELIATADTGLYEAKGLGGSHVSAGGPDEADEAAEAADAGRAEAIPDPEAFRAILLAAATTTQA